MGRAERSISKAAKNQRKRVVAVRRDDIDNVDRAIHGHDYALEKFRGNVVASDKTIEEVMKRNGDIKLAAVPPAPAVILELTGVDRFFEIYENASDAVESFHQFPAHALQHVRQPWLAAFHRAEGAEHDLKMAG